MCPPELSVTTLVKWGWGGTGSGELLCEGSVSSQEGVDNHMGASSWKWALSHPLFLPGRRAHHKALVRCYHLDLRLPSLHRFLSCTNDLVFDIYFSHTKQSQDRSRVAYVDGLRVT